MRWKKGFIYVILFYDESTQSENKNVRDGIFHSLSHPFSSVHQESQRLFNENEQDA